jgi:hypothetical protein
VCSEEQRRDEGEDAVREKLSQVGTESYVQTVWFEVYSLSVRV